MTTQQILESAVQRHQAGQLHEAESLYRQVIAENPNHAAALHLWGILSHQQNRPQVAADLIRRSISLQPEVAEAHYNLGLLYHQQNQLPEAIASYRRALSLDPDMTKARVNLGSALRAAGQLKEAIDCYRAAAELRPDLVEAHYNLANALQADGQIDEAITCYRRALSLNPDYAQAYNNLGYALWTKKQFDEAMARYRRAITLNPNYAEAHNNLGSAQSEKQEYDAAVASFQRALTLDPNFIEAHINLGNAHLARGEFDEAMSCYRQALAIAPTLFQAHNNLAHALKLTGELDQAIAAYHRALSIVPGDVSASQGLGNALLTSGQLADAVSHYRAAIQLNPNNAAVHSDLVYCLHFDPRSTAQSMHEEQRAWNERHALPLRHLIQPHQNDFSSPDRRLRVGYVSGDLRDHIVGHNLLQLVREHDRAGFEIFYYSNVRQPDAFTAQHRASADHWRDIAAAEDQAAAHMIRQDRIDILVDHSLHSAGNRLLVFAQKPAPIQATFMGYPGGTGLDTMNYRITDPYLDAPGATDANYSEQSIRLPNSFWCYDPRVDGEKMQPGPLPALSTDHITFGSLNNFCKIDDALLELWAQVMSAVPNSRLLMLAPRGSSRRRVLDKMQSAGIPENRIGFTEHQPREQYLQLYRRIDIGLDCFPYNGHTTSLDSLWMGVPLVTMVGSTVVGRGGWSQLSNLNLTELAAHTNQEYVNIARDLAADLPRLIELRKTLRQRMQNSPLMDATKFARDIEAVYRQLWLNFTLSRK